MAKTDCQVIALNPNHQSTARVHKIVVLPKGVPKKCHYLNTPEIAKRYVVQNGYYLGTACQVNRSGTLRRCRHCTPQETYYLTAHWRCCLLRTPSLWSDRLDNRPPPYCLFPQYRDVATLHTPHNLVSGVSEGIGFIPSIYISCIR